MKYRLELNNISKSFGDVHANKNINLQVKKGEIQALLGENGAGKSTLVKMIYGILAPDKGEIKAEIGFQIPICSFAFFGARSKLFNQILLELHHFDLH